MKQKLQLFVTLVLLVVAGFVPVTAAADGGRSLSLSGESALSKDFSEDVAGIVSLKRINDRSSDRLVRKAASVASQATEAVVTVPFVHTLGKDESSTNTSLYSLIDANEDSRTWKIGGFTGYSVCMKPNTDAISASDDWLVSPKIDLKAGEEYILSYEEGTALTSQGDVLEVKMGLGATVADMTIELVAAHTFTNKTFNKVEKRFTVAADGHYRVGFHAMSDKATSGNVKVCNFSIVNASSVVDPPAAGTISYKLFPKGELKASVTYTAPTLTVAGASLEAISKVVITDSQNQTYEYVDVAPGEVINVDVLLKNSARNNIQAVAYLNNAEGEPVAGETATTGEFYAGLDNPLTPQNAKAELSADGKKVTVSWDRVPEVGENGGYVDPEKVVYYIFDAFGSYYDPALATTADNVFEFDYSAESTQDFKAFQITAGMEETYYSLAVNTNIVTTGDPMSLPFNESFSDGSFAQAWCVDPASSYDMQAGIVNDNVLQTNADDEGAEPQYLNSQDGDNGFFFFLPIYKDDVYGIFSGKIDISKAKNPVLEFFYQGKGSVLDVMLSVDGVKFEVLNTIDLKVAPTSDWTLAQYDLKPYLKYPFVQFEVRLRAIHNDDTHTWSVPLDNIRVRDLADTDLKLMSVVVPPTADAGKDVVVSARIENLGAKASARAKATLLRNGKEQEQKEIPAMQPNEISIVEFNDMARLDDDDPVVYRVEIEIAGDADMSNNALETIMNVAMPVYPSVTNLAAMNDANKVNLSWTAPDYASLMQPAATLEDFENPNYLPMTISNFGDWVVRDVDGLKTYYIPNWGETGNPYRTQPQAFQLYNPQIAGVVPECLIDVPPHSGNQLLIAWSCQGQNDNWLISPKLSGEAQTVSFFARSFTIAFPESFEVYYTLSGTENFVKVETVENYPENDQLPEVWTEYKVALPAGAERFAIRHTSYDTYAMYVDDISYEAAAVAPADLSVLGYNVYRDGVKVNDTPVADTSFTDVVEADGLYTYRVSAVYNYGESRHCQGVSVMVENSGVEGIEVSGKPVKYYNLQGVMVSSENLVPGIYIKTEGGRSKKVIVK